MSPISTQSNLIEQILLLPEDLFAHVLKFDENFFPVFQLLAKKTNERAVSLLFSYMIGIIQVVDTKNTLFSQRIASLYNKRIHQFHELIHANARIYGGKWGWYCLKFAWPEGISDFIRQIQEERDKNLFSTWNILRELILMQNPDLDLPGSEDAPQIIRDWIKNNLDRCFGITLRSLPLRKGQLDLLKAEMEENHNQGIRADWNSAVFSAPIVVHSKMHLKSRLARDLDRLLISQGFNCNGESLKIIRIAMKALSSFFQDCKCQDNTAHDPTLMTLQYTKSKIKVNIQHTREVQTSQDPPLTLHFHTSRDLKLSLYFDESYERDRIAEIVGRQLTPLETIYLPSFVNRGLAFLRKIHAEQNQLHAYTATYFRVIRNGEENPKLFATISESNWMIEIPVQSAVTLRIQIVKTRQSPLKNKRIRRARAFRN